MLVSEDPPSAAPAVSSMRPECDVVVQAGSRSSEPNAIISGVGAIQATAKVLVEADHLSLTTIRSKSFFDGAAALDSVDSSLDALSALESSVTELRNELCQRPGQFAPPICFARNESNPIMRLVPDVLLLIIEELVHEWQSCPGDIGWITTTHVCTTWRRVITQVASLWARSLGTLSTRESFDVMLSRARGSRLTLSRRRTKELDDLPEYYWDTLSQDHRFRAVDLCLDRHDITRLAEFMRQRPDIVIESLSLSSNEDCTGNVYAGSPSLPSLRSLAFCDVYLPLRAPNLVSLSVQSRRGSPLSALWTKVLDTLERCENLVFLQLDTGTSERLPSGNGRVVCLSRLEVFTALCLQSAGRCKELFQNLEVPALRYLVLEVCTVELTFSTLRVISRWLLSGTQAPPCTRNATDLSIDLSRSDDTRDVFRFYLDDGSVASTEARSTLLEEYIQSTSDLQHQQGIHIYFGEVKRMTATGREVNFARDAVDGCALLYGSSLTLPAIRNTHLDLGMETSDIDWNALLQSLVNTESLYASYFDLFTLLPALSQAMKDGTMLLPRLRTIVCKEGQYLAQDLLGPEDDAERIEMTGLICGLLSARAARGVPVTCMRAPCEDEREKEEKVDACLAQLVSLYA